MSFSRPGWHRWPATGINDRIPWLSIRRDTPKTIPPELSQYPCTPGHHLMRLQEVPVEPSTMNSSFQWKIFSHAQFNRASSAITKRGETCYLPPPFDHPRFATCDQVVILQLQWCLTSNHFCFSALLISLSSQVHQ